MDEKEIKRLESALNSKKKNALKKITPLVGREIAILLVSIPHSVSPKELEVVATLIGSFESLRVYQHSNLPYHVVVEGQTADGYLVRFTPQYRIAQPIKENGKQNPPWCVDLLVQLFAEVNGREIRVAALGYEYDGHDSHYVETGVKNAYIRDWNILLIEDVKIVRISPVSWSDSSWSYVAGLKKFFKRRIDDLREVQVETVKSLFVDSDLAFVNVDDDVVVTCKVCNGRCKLASMECPGCNGMGSLPKSKLKNFDMSSYDRIPCPECSGAIECRACRGSGITSRDVLLSFGR